MFHQQQLISLEIFLEDLSLDLWAHQYRWCSLVTKPLLLSLKASCFFYILSPFRWRRFRLLLEVHDSLCKEHLSILAFERCSLLPFPVTWGSSAEPSLGNKLSIFDCTLVLFNSIRLGAERYRDNNCAMVFLWEHHYLKMKYRQLKLHCITVKGERI